MLSQYNEILVREHLKSNIFEKDMIFNLFHINKSRYFDRISYFEIVSEIMFFSYEHISFQMQYYI